MIEPIIITPLLLVFSFLSSYYFKDLFVVKDSETVDTTFKDSHLTDQ